MRILLVDDHEIVRLGLRELLSHSPRYEVVGEASTAEEAVKKASECQPDVVVMDIRMPGKGGIQATREIREKLPDTQVIMLTSYAEDALLFDAMKAGASGYVLKQIGSDNLFEVLEAVERGEVHLNPELTKETFRWARETARSLEDEAFSSLSDQELRVLALIPSGKTNKEIASEICLSEKTVRNYVSSILNKLDLKTRSEAAAYAVKHHIGDFLPAE